jgi:hypothetical protein
MGHSPGVGAAQAHLLSEIGEVASVHFTTSTTIPRNAAPAVDVTITDEATAQALFKETLTLPEVTPGPRSCPMASGVVYRLEFYGNCPEKCATPILLTVDFPPDGCATLTSPSLPDALSTSSSYWEDLAADLGIVESRIYPYSVE